MKCYQKNKFWIFYSIEFALIAITLVYVLREFSILAAGDGYNQYYPVMVYTGKYIRGVLKSFLALKPCIPQFDFTIGLGEGIIPALSYYGFGDPFLLLSALFPVKYSAIGYLIIMLSKMFVAGITISVYCKSMGAEYYAILMGLPIYIGSQFFICHSMLYPTTFLTMMVTLPIMCLGVEEYLLRRGKGFSFWKRISKKFIIAVSFQAFNGFYNLYMELVFVAVYALVYILCEEKVLKNILNKIFELLIQVFWGIGIAAIYFIPAVVGYFSSGRGNVNNTITVSELFF